VSADDRRLIAECLGGQAAAFGELVRRYQDRLFNSVYRLLGNAEDAQDVVQEAFLSAYQALGRFKGESQFFTWLYRIAFNTAVSLKRKHRVVLSLQGGRGDEGNLLEPVDPSPFSNPGHAIDQADRENVVQKALGHLSAEHRAVLVLKDVENQSYEIMAEILGVPLGTVRSRLHRARLELRRLLEEAELKG
jgi:RNA polymerase sigma-70 factor (ECF subfamily)